MPQVTKLGYASDHGGFFMDASPTLTDGGIGVVRKGDRHNCPLPGHGITPMQSGGILSADGKPVCRVGVDAAACGAKPIANDAIISTD